MMAPEGNLVQREMHPTPGRQFVLVAVLRVSAFLLQRTAGFVPEA
jgi:hypothetical protein